jgi:tricorn protease interacting factor F2/3
MLIIALLARRHPLCGRTLPSGIKERTTLMPETIKPVHYQLNIIPDLKKFQFTGQATIHFESARKVGEVSLNILELAVWQCRLKTEHGWRACAFRVEPHEELLTIMLDDMRPGGFQLQIDYEGSINNQMAGFYRSGYEKDGTKHHIAVTQFQESSARQAFPCMDHPLYKATFDVTMTVPDHLQVIANTAILREEQPSEGVKQVVFERTPVMSTYLVFFGVGEFEIVQDDQDPRVRVATLPGLTHTTPLGLSFGRKALHYCETYYGIDYPLSKMDLIAVPDFAFGAMENWGAITFRENLLLHFPETTSAEGVERICEVIAHEIAHQWFGNLVTPADWKYLWLNESFATYFGYGVVAHTHPDWGTWDQFLHSQTSSALVRDGLIATFPIEIPGGDHVVINSSTAPIIYNKGASMLRMIEGYIGSDRYRQGVQTYLARHTYACAESHNLWEAFEDASAVPVTAMVQNWVGQPGYPLLTAKRDGCALTIAQQRFTYLSQVCDQSWMVPVVLTSWNAAGQSKGQSVILDAPAMTIELPSDTVAYKLNGGQSGFYRVHYDDDENLSVLGDRVRGGAMPDTDRWGLQNDLYALVRAGRLPLGAYLDFLTYYNHEAAYLPLVGIAANLQHAYGVLAEDGRHRIEAVGRALCDRVLSNIGMAPQKGEPHTRAALRNQLLWQGAAWGLGPVLEFAEDAFGQMMAGKKVHADIARSVMQVGALTKGAMALDWFKRRFVESPSEHERMNILAGMAAFDQWDLIEKALAFTLASVPPRNQFSPIAAAGGNTVAAPHLWDWYQGHLQALEDFHPLLYERVITGIVPLGGLGREDEVNSFFGAYLEAAPHLKDAVELALEYLEINTAMRTAGAANP